MKTLMVLAGVLLLGLVLLWTVSTQQRVAELERRLDEVSRRAQPGPEASAPTAQGTVSSGSPGRIAALERRLDALERAEDPVGERSAPVPAEQPPGASGVLEQDSLEDLASNFGLYDTDGDELLDAEELAVEPLELRTLDLNSDRRVGSDEVDRLRELSVNARAAAVHLDSADSEFPIASDDFEGGARRFAFLDRDGDGFVSEAEFISTLTDAIRELRRFDLDHNGALTEAELWDAPTRFAASDQDGDGLVYAWEVSALMARAKW